MFKSTSLQYFVDNNLYKCNSRVVNRQSSYLFITVIQHKNSLNVAWY